MTKESRGVDWVVLAAASSLATIICAALAMRSDGATSVLFIVLMILAIAGIGASFGIRAQRSGS